MRKNGWYEYLEKGEELEKKILDTFKELPPVSKEFVWEEKFWRVKFVDDKYRVIKAGIVELKTHTNSEFVLDVAYINVNDRCVYDDEYGWHRYSKENEKLKKKILEVFKNKKTT